MASDGQGQGRMWLGADAAAWEGREECKRRRRMQPGVEVMVSDVAAQPGEPDEAGRSDAGILAMAFIDFVMSIPLGLGPVNPRRRGVGMFLSNPPSPCPIATSSVYQRCIDSTIDPHERVMLSLFSD
uniref:Uncharacterized protein n=1 Tax=Oryza rufipogon TaxID=4529 RepID=A0A0E0N169_ORYRU